MYQYKTTWTKGMNTRPAPNVNNTPNGTVAYGATVEGDAIQEYTVDGANFKAGDKWMRLVGDAVKWVAVVHMGVTYGILTETNPPTKPEPPTSAFPQSFTLTNPDGSKAEYVFVRVIE